MIVKHSFGYVVVCLFLVERKTEILSLACVILIRECLVCWCLNCVAVIFSLSALDGCHET